MTDHDDPCCLLYREHYLLDHEYGCPARLTYIQNANEQEQR